MIEGYAWREILSVASARRDERTESHRPGQALQLAGDPGEPVEGEQHPEAGHHQGRGQRDGQAVPADPGYGAEQTAVQKADGQEGDRQPGRKKAGSTPADE